MSSKRYMVEFKTEAVKQITERGYPASEKFYSRKRRHTIRQQKKLVACIQILVIRTCPIKCPDVNEFIWNNRR